MANATGYRVYRSTTSGSETFLVAAGGMTANDDGSVTPSDTDKAPTTDPNSGIGIAVAVNVVFLTTTAYVDGNLDLVANTVTIETVAPGAAATTVNWRLPEPRRRHAHRRVDDGLRLGRHVPDLRNHRGLLLREQGRDASLRDHRLLRHAERHRDHHRRKLDLHRARHLGRRRE